MNIKKDMNAPPSADFCLPTNMKCEAGFAPEKFPDTTLLES